MPGSRCGCSPPCLPSPDECSRHRICSEQSIPSKYTCSPKQDVQGGVGGTNQACSTGRTRAPANGPTATFSCGGAPQCWAWVPPTGFPLLTSHPKAASWNVGHAQTRPAEEGGDTERKATQHSPTEGGCSKVQAPWPQASKGP